MLMNSHAERVVIGLVADPGLPYSVAGRIAERLPSLLARWVDPDVCWRVDVRCEAVPLVDDGEIPILRMADDLVPSQHWDAMVCLTELPRRLGTKPVIFSLSTAHREGLVSMPALGWLWLRKHTIRTVLYAVSRLLAEAPGLGRTASSQRSPGTGRGSLDSTGSLESKPATVRLPGDHLTIAGEELESHVARPGVGGQLRLLMGMVRHNRPWRLVPSLDRAIAAAAAAAAFPIFYSTLWAMANASSPSRLALINLLAVSAMVTWLVTHNRLWNRRRGFRADPHPMMYNLSTCLTVFLGVCCMYALLFAITTVAAGIVIAPGYLAHALHHPAGPTAYLKIAWLASSMGTVAGALGSSFETEASIRQATYSRREQERWQRTYPADQDES